jgi:hypothetical protein
MYEFSSFITNNYYLATNDISYYSPAKGKQNYPVYMNYFLHNTVSNNQVSNYTSTNNKPANMAVTNGKWIKFCSVIEVAIKKFIPIRKVQSLL